MRLARNGNTVRRARRGQAVVESRTAFVRANQLSCLKSYIERGQ